MKVIFLTPLLIFMSATVSQARVFSFDKEAFAGYFLITGGMSTVKDQAFANESSATSYGSEVKTNTGGEIGFSYITGRAAWRFGFEIIKPNTLSGVSAQASGSEVYQLKSDINSYIPKLGIELIVFQRPSVRLAIFGFAGTASLSLKNDYTSLTVSPNSDFSVEAKSATNLMGGGFLGEFHMMDTTTFLLEASYRDLKFKDIKYSKNVTSGFNGAITAGDPMVDTSGNKRSIDLSGPYLSVGFRFWLR